MDKNKKSWEHRLKGKPDESAIEFVESLSIDRRLYKYDIAGSIAHARMLADKKLISKSDFSKIRKGLLEISEEISKGEFEFDKSREDIHMAIEAALIDKIGESGEKLHTARSRNDQIATDMRLWVRDHIEVLHSYLTRLQDAFVELAEKYTEDIMPSYTHLQRAQPVVIAAYLLSFVEQFERDYARLADCAVMNNVCPLGSGAVAGTTLDIDRHATSSELGFFEVSGNSIDSISDRDFCVEFVFGCSMIGSHLSRLAEDWIIYSTSEFDFIHIDDKYCTSSSMMPQKRNPDMLELIRGRTGNVYGALTALLTMLKSIPSGYNRDLQEEKRHVFSAFDTIASCVQMAEAIVRNTAFKTEKIKAGLDEGFLDATCLAEYLVKKSVAFREAHGIVGKLVAYCEDEGKDILSELSVEEFKKYCDKIEDDVYSFLGAENVVKRYASEGSGGTEQAKERIKYWKERLGER